MRITKDIDIRQEVEIDLSVEDITLVFDDEFGFEQKSHVFRQLNSVIQYLKAIPDTFIDKLDNEFRQRLFKALSEQVEKFKPRGE